MKWMGASWKNSSRAKQRSEMYKQSVLNLLELERAHIAQFIAAQSEQDRAAIGALEQWAAKDMLVHLDTTRTYLVELLDTLERGATPKNFGEIHRASDEIFAANQERAWQDIADALDSSYDKLVARVQDLSDAAFEKRVLTDGFVLWQGFAGLFMHDEEHLEEWYVERNQLETADCIVEQYADALARAFPQTELHGQALYNRACFYARNYMEEMALPFLCEAISIHAELVEMARQDADFLALQNDAEFQQLLNRGQRIGQTG